MIIVHKFAPGWGLPDLSPFVVKLETYLRMAGIPYEGVTGDVRKAPKKKLPYIEHDGRKIADSSIIVEHLRRALGDKLDVELGKRELAVAAAFQAMLEEQLYFVILYQRWQDDRGWETYLPVLRGVLGGAGVPAPLRGIVAGTVRKQIVKGLHTQGTGRHSRAEVDAIATRIVQAVSDWLDEKPFFFGERPATLDATVYAFLSGLLDPPIASATRTHAEGLANVRGYLSRVKSTYWS